MDSSLAEQIVEKRPSLSFLLPVLKPLEAATLRRAAVVVPVCEALERIASSAGASHTIVLTDPPVFSVPCHADAAAVRRQIGLPGPVFMYVGNLEVYQGVGLLLEAFATAARHGCQASLVVVGGKPADVAAHQVMAASLGIDDRTRFLGPKPLLETGALVGGADVLVSPRITGVNTPMKIYAYLNAGKPILATDIESHSQVLTDQIAVLAPPSSERLAEAICRLANDPDLRRQLGERAARVAREKYSQDAFAATVRRLCQLIESQTAA
jgi:glycosyltransferase involved in cell wall biosynthesis